MTFKTESDSECAQIVRGCFLLLDLSIDRLVLCSNGKLPSAMLHRVLLYSEMTPLSEKVAPHNVLCLHHRSHIFDCKADL